MNEQFHPNSSFLRDPLRVVPARLPFHTANVQIGREWAKVQVFEDGITRLLVPHIPNFHGFDPLTPIEHKAFRKQRRAVVRELIEATERRALGSAAGRE